MKLSTLIFGVALAGALCSATMKALFYGPPEEQPAPESSEDELAQERQAIFETELWMQSQLRNLSIQG